MAASPVFSSARASFALAVLLISLIGLFARPVTSLQVTPGSPCSDMCIDGPDMDESDPESSNTTGDDINCSDEDFSSQETGQKFQRCLSCLQDSDYSEGHESDQQWFLYNLRYSIDYCILGYPNATDIESSPCMTSEACGRLEGPLKDGIVEPAYSEPYDFCDADGGDFTDEEAVDACLACVRAGNSHRFLSNFVIALQAGCEQKPADGVTIGLNDTIFGAYSVEITDPRTKDGSSSSDDGAPALQPSIIAAIAVGAFAAVLLAAGCVYMQIRKRRNRARRSSSSSRSSNSGSPDNAGGAPIASPLSFRCQTHVTPRSPEFPPSALEKPYADPGAALSSNPHVIGARISVKPISTSGHSPGGSTTNYHSPDDYFTTPTSTVSTRSNAPLLLGQYRPYNPASYASSDTPTPTATSANEHMSSSYADYSAISRGRQPRTSPYMEQRGFQASQREQSLWSQADTVGGPLRETIKKKAAFGEPVQVTKIQTSFPPPPKR